MSPSDEGVRPFVIGVGSMGSRLAQRLANGGLDVTVWNRTADRATRLAGARIRAVGNLEDGLSKASVVLTCLADDAAVFDLWREQGARLQGLTRGRLVIDCSTTLPDTARSLAAICSDAGWRMIDAPISGGPEAAEAGSLSFLCGGDAADVTEAKPLLSRLGTAIVHVGGHGSGQMAKLLSQVMMAGTLLGVAEALALAEATGVNSDALIDALKPGAAGSWVLEHRAPLMASGQFPHAGALSLHLKDLENVLHVARRAGLELPGTELVASIERRLRHEGYGSENVAALARAYRSYDT